MSKAFFIVGPTATGKSALAAKVAQRVGGEIVSADAFQIYKEFALLTARPDPSILALVPHHLIGELSVTETMSAERFRQLAAERIQAIQERGNPVLVVGGSGLYIKALTHGIRLAPQSDSKLQNELGKMSLEELQTRLLAIDPTAASRVDLKNPRRIIRALELSVAPSGPVERTWLANEAGDTARGVFVTRDRDELKTRINQRVEEMFAAGVVEEVRRVGGNPGLTAEKTLGFCEIRDLLEGKIDRAACVHAIQAQTRQYAKRQLTWFRHQSNFLVLNLSSLTFAEAIDQVAERVLSPS